MQLKSQEMSLIRCALEQAGQKKILEKSRLWLKAPMVTAIREADI